jgi:hypothetical protein
MVFSRADGAREVDGDISSLLAADARYDAAK